MPLRKKSTEGTFTSREKRDSGKKRKNGTIQRSAKGKDFKRVQK